MSGPKDADFYLDIETQRILEEQRQRKLLESLVNSKKNSITENFNKFKNYYNNFGKKLEIYEVCKELYSEKNSIAKETSNEFNKLINKYFEKDIIGKSFNVDKNEIEVLENYLKELDIFNEIISNRTIIMRHMNSEINRKAMEHSSKNIFGKIDDDIFNFKIENNSEEQVKDESNDDYSKVIEEFKNMYEKLNNKYILNKGILNLKNEEVENLIKDNQLPIEYKISQIKDYIKEIYEKEPGFIEEENLNKKREEDYNSKYALYEIICKNLNIEKELVKTEDITSINKEILLIEEEIDRLKKVLAEKEEYNYIVDSINEIMIELGYNVISSDIMKKVNRTIVDNIYEFDDKSVLNVFTSDNGTIMFEVTGISNEKKEPTSLDKLKIKESMDNFCNKYSLIKEKLAERGILFGKENLKPAEEKYARIRVVSEEKYKVSNKMNVKSKNYKNKYLN